MTHEADISRWDWIAVAFCLCVVMFALGLVLTGAFLAVAS